MMEQVSDSATTFFDAFERGSNTFDRDLLSLLFSDPFMAADPHGGIQVAKKDDFLAGIAQRQAFFHSLGFQFVKIRPLVETRVDDHYTMVKVHSQMRFEKNAGQPIDLKDVATYILFMQDDTPKIVFYTTHENLMTLLQESGLLPSKNHSLDNSGTL